MLPGEFWYGLASCHGTQFPLNADSRYHYQATAQLSGEQDAALLLSSLGRYIWSEAPFDTDVSHGIITLSGAREDLALYEGYENLRGAFLAAASRHFPANGKLPPENFFRKPQYNTWSELIYDQTQKSILGYAHGIVDHNMPAGILMIDDGWMRYYGNWKFNLATFPDPKAMLDELHGLGFEVMLWLCPFVSPDSPEYRFLAAKDMLIRGSNGKPLLRKWWNGWSALLDMSNPHTCDWLRAQLQELMDMGVDGFKFDGGGAHYYDDQDLTFGNVTAQEQCSLWSRFGSRFAYNECRSTWHCAGLPVVERLGDKPHKWKSVAQLVPDTLQQGILGYPFGCPDMVGGGSFTDFLPGAPSLDPELFARYAQAAALMTMIQFSAAPWRVLDEKHAEICRQAGLLHHSFADTILDLARHAAQTGEPIVRHMEYVFPGEGLGGIRDQFMLGDNWLVAPVTEPGARSRTVCLPRGRWQYVDGTVYEGGCTIHVPAPLEILPRFQKI